MDVLIKQATIVSEGSPYHLKVKDILIQRGKIVKIDKLISSNGIKEIEAKGLHVSVGWIDLQANIQDPGYEHKEDINSASNAAAAGGFTKIVVSPLSDPVRDSKSQLEYLKKYSSQPVELLPLGTLSKGANGKELAELYDLKEAGAVGFSDGKKSVKNPNVLNRALLYTQAFDGVVFNFPHTDEVAYQGVMNEGETSTHLGLKGIPELAESLMVARDLNILEYTGGKLHFNCISTSKSIELISKAKKDGMQVTCDLSSYNLLLDETELGEFDTRFKTLPPLRSKGTIKTLIKGIKNGTIDAICSDHTPEDVEEKMKEFDHAAFGIINLQTSFSAANSALRNTFTISEIIPLFTSGPAKVLGLNLGLIEEGEKAELTLFLPEEEFTFTKEMVLSKSKNSPFFNRKLHGKVVGIINGSKVVLN
ncbi:MAG: dihydroorotase [Vicingaceae bacterium]|jgi:dihydroorotase